MLNRVIVWNCETHESIVSLKQMIIPFLLIMLIGSALTLLTLLISTVPSARCAERRHGGKMQ
jgi:Na+/alanine symporter